MDAMMQQYFAMFARYNAWANRRLYGRAAELPDGDYRAERGAFFGSVHGTLNHLLVTDRIWLNRFTGSGPTYRRLDLVLHEELAPLRAEREAEDARIVAWVDTLDAGKLAGSFTYTPITNPHPVTQPLAPTLGHFFNHQTHHRGQVHALLTAIGGRAAAPELDLAYFQRETGIGLSA
jgi:uncharacterized damage-inducible protein DinB